ncbi:cryptochrome/photolyase family protein [Spongiimicrobium sp. 3-5]|uniref:cryptochrome/photolyase family protein n=1 Tax=Spongiimicrobium sp. 3-5 TaxID=3332596 RepID=UPI00397F3063
MDNKVSIFWFRRDLRLQDNIGLLAALKDNYKVLPIFIFDNEILDRLPKNDARVSFIHTTLQNMNLQLKKTYDSGIALYKGEPLKVFQEILRNHQVHKVFTNRDYEPYALKRDKVVGELLHENGIGFSSYKDQVIFEKNEVVKADGNPYIVYTPYMRRWKQLLNAAQDVMPQDTSVYLHNLVKNSKLPWLSITDIGFEPAAIKIPIYNISPLLINNYEATRNYPALPHGTSRLGPHLRFGTVSIRKMVQEAMASKNQVFLNELIWREFFMQILWHFPNTVNEAFKKKYDRIPWRNNEAEFEKWKNGQTGYALVDAGMRELNTTGHMHNRVRMLVASFLCKHLLIDWRWGEAYFAERLLDYELSSNVGNWQWAAGSGVDAAPYFRIFNPTTQIDKFDKQKTYVNYWVPDLQELTYPQKMVDHKMARERCLKVYKEALS